MNIFKKNSADSHFLKGSVQLNNLLPYKTTSIEPFFNVKCGKYFLFTS